jgi:hypothetical protein
MGAGGVSAAAAVANPQRRQWPDYPAVGPVVLWRDAADQHVHDGLRIAVVQAEDRDVGAVQLGQLGYGRGQTSQGARGPACGRRRGGSACCATGREGPRRAARRCRGRGYPSWCTVRRAGRGRGWPGAAHLRHAVRPGCGRARRRRGSAPIASRCRRAVMRPRWKARADPGARRLVPCRVVMAVSSEQCAGILPHLLHGGAGSGLGWRAAWAS